ncbi:SymE family type I addiction module toxin [Hornefia porci]
MCKGYSGNMSDFPIWRILQQNYSNRKGVIMSDKMIRKLKIYCVTSIQYKDFPKILLQGKWLEQCGFNCGDRIEVHCEEGRLTILLVKQE